MNGLPTGTFRIQVEGHDSTSQNDPNWTSTVSHASVDSIEEFSLQTSNFARRVQPGGWGVLQLHHQIRNQPVPRRRLRVPDQRGSGRLSSLLYRLPFPAPTPAAARTISAARSAVRCGFPKVYNGKEQDVLLLQRRGLPQRHLPNGSTFLTLPTAASEPATSVPTPSFPARTSARSGWKRPPEWRDLRPCHTHHAGKPDGGRHALPRQHHSAKPLRPGRRKDPEPDPGADQRQPDQQLGRKQPGS